MILRYPSYYKRFSCIAERCEDTCCAGWEIDIDDDSYDYYMSIEGEFGERLRRNIREYPSDGEDVYEAHGFILKEDKRCPFLDNKGLCDLYKELGEDALCDVCTDTPRNFLEYGGTREISISAACAEAGRLIYGEEEKITFVEEEVSEEFGWEESKEEKCLAHQIRMARDWAVHILQNRELSIEKRISAFLSFAEEVQACLNENEPEKIEKISWEKYLQYPVCKEEEYYSKNALESQRYEMFLRRMVTFTRLDSVNEEWEGMLQQMQKVFVDQEAEEELSDAERRTEERGSSEGCGSQPASSLAEGFSGAERRTDERGSSEGCGSQPALVYIQTLQRLKEELAGQRRAYEYEHLMVYYVFTCQARCVDDYDFIGKAKLAVVSFLMIRDMDALRFAVKGSYEKEDRVDIARIYAREVEHSEENLEFLADEFLFEEVYRTDLLQKAL